jgi:flagellar hook-length control protein FliK
MITLQAPISPTIPAAGAARGDANGAEPEGGTEIPSGPQFAALMAGMLPEASKPGAAATTGTSATDTDTGQDEHAPPAIDAAAAIESAIAIAIALPALAPANAAAPIPAAPAPSGAASVRGDAGASGAHHPIGEFPAPQRDAAPAGADEPASAAPIPAAPAPSGAASVHGDPGASGAHHPIREFPAPQRDAAPAGADEPASAAPPPDGSAHGFAHAFDLPPQAPDAAQAARQPEPQAPQPAPSAPAAHSPRIDAPLGSPRWREDLAGHITVLVRNASPEAEIRVTPPELGPIHARVSVDNGVASVTLSAPSPETRDALEAALTTLRERLAESGLALGGASVSGERAPRDAPGDERLARAADANAADPLPPAPAVRRLRIEGLVDLYA